MSQSEDVLTIAERNVRNAEEHVAHQRAIVEQLDRDGHKDAAERARKVFANLQTSLKLARAHLRKERVEREDGLTAAARHVQEAEQYVAHQIAIADQLDRDGHKGAAERARTVLATLQESLELARTHLQRERAGRGTAS